MNNLRGTKRFGKFYGWRAAVIDGFRRRANGDRCPKFSPEGSSWPRRAFPRTARRIPINIVCIRAIAEFRRDLNSEHLSLCLGRPADRSPKQRTHACTYTYTRTSERPPNVTPLRIGHVFQSHRGHCERSFFFGTPVSQRILIFRREPFTAMCRTQYYTVYH